jgi:general secretion pathway protein J
MTPGVTPRVTPGREHGSTLLELLVSLVIFGLLLAALGQGTRFALAAHQSQAHQIEVDADLDTVDRTVRHLINTMNAGLTADMTPHFVANSRSMGFTAALPAMAWYPTRQADVIVAVDAAHRLVLRWAPHYPVLLGPPPLPQVTPLLDGVDHIELSYWTAGRTRGLWVDRWDAKVLPELVRLRIVFFAKDRRRWPDIVAATAVN